MRTDNVLFCLLLLLTTIPMTMRAMDDPDENTWIAAIINKLKKKADPLGYATNNKAIKAYSDALSYNPANQNSATLNLDDRSKKVIKKIIPRIIAGLDILETIVKSNDPDHPHLNAMIKAKKNMPGFFSECDDAILFGLQNWKYNIHKRALGDSDDYLETPALAQSMAPTQENKDNKPMLTVSAAQLKKLALKKYNWWNPFELLAEGLNYLSKHYVLPIDHLTTSDSQEMCTGILYFHPSHPLHNTDREFTLNPELDWHRLLVGKIIDRRKIFLVNFAYYLSNNKRNQVMQLSRPKTENPNSTIPLSIFSEVTDSLSSGYLAFVKGEQLNNIPTNAKELAEKLKNDEESKKAAAEAEKKRKIEELQQKEIEEKQKQDEALKKAAALAEKKRQEEIETEETIRRSFATAAEQKEREELAKKQKQESEKLAEEIIRQKQEYETIRKKLEELRLKEIEEKQRQDEAELKRLLDEKSRNQFLHPLMSSSEESITIPGRLQQQ